MRTVGGLFPVNLGLPELGALARGGVGRIG
jgi:hypothetical protein